MSRTRPRLYPAEVSPASLISDIDEPSSRMSPGSPKRGYSIRRELFFADNSPPLPTRLEMGADAFLNMTEFTLDLIFDNEEDRDRAFDFINRHHVKKGHRTDVRYYKGTRYTDRRWAPTNFVAYRPEFAKLTGELYCLHLEWRVCGVAALRRMRIDGIKDLIEFDHHSHWASKLRLRTFDCARLGRTYANGLMKKHKHTPRKPRVYKTRRGFEYHTDKRLGQMLLRINDTVQGVIDFANKRKIPVRSCLTPIDNDAWFGSK